VNVTLLLALLAATATTLLTGVGAMAAAWPRAMRPPERPRKLLMITGFGAAAGFGLQSVPTLVASLIAPEPTSAAGAIVLGSLVLALVAVLAGGWRVGASIRHAPAVRVEQVEPATGPRPAMRLLLAGVVAIGVVGVAINGWYVLQQTPFAHNDAMLMWNLKAQLLLGAGPGEASPESWVDRLNAMHWRHHGDYPLLWPAAVAHVWAWCELFGQGRPPAGPATASALYLLAMLCLAGGAVAWRRGIDRAWLLVALLLASPAVFHSGVDQIADGPLGLMILASVLAATLAIPARRSLDEQAAPLDGRWLAIAWGFAGLAAWTKNEGLVFLVLLAGWTTIAAATRSAGQGGWRRTAWTLAPAGLAAAPGVAMTLAVKAAVKVDNPVLDDADAATKFLRVFSPERHAELAGNFGWTLLTAPGIAVAPLLGVLAIGAIWRAPGRCRAAFNPGHGGGAAALAIASQLAVYLAIYLTIVPDETLKQSVWTSADRLWMHLYPAALTLAFLAWPSAGEPRESSPDTSS